MTIHDWLKSNIEKLAAASVSTPQLDAEVLLSHSLTVDRSWLHAHSDHVLQRSDLRKLEAMVSRRIKHEPIAYIIGKQEFYGRDFAVSPDTLTPRPETETMLELLFKQIKNGRSEIGEKIQIIDVGTGSGCIIITAALELAKISNLTSKISYSGLDISQQALKIARKNAKIYKTVVDFEHFDLLTQNLSSIPDLRSSVSNPRSTVFITANLPYVPTDFQISLAASHEPPVAIFGGADGLDYYRVLFSKLPDNTKFVLTESLPPQHKELEAIANKHGFMLEKTQDFIQVFSR